MFLTFVKKLRPALIEAPCRSLIITGGCRILLSNITFEEVIEVDELKEGNTSAETGKQEK